MLQSSEYVLVLEFMDGIRLNDHQSLDAFGIDKQKVVEEITRAYSHQIYVDGFFNGDPHPGKSSTKFKMLNLFTFTVLIETTLHNIIFRKFSCQQGTSSSSYFT